MAERLYGATEIGAMLGLSRDWVMEHARYGGPPAEYEAMKGKHPQSLWSAAALGHWRAYHASGESLPPTTRYCGTFSDHNAVNQMGPVTVTWKLWWRCTHDGGTSWWFSTPRGWWNSEDDGRSWKPTEAMVRPSEYRYYSVSGNARPAGAVNAVLREAQKLRQWIESIPAANDNPFDISSESNYGGGQELCHNETDRSAS